MNTLIVTGGSVNIEFIKNFLENNKFDKIIAVDKGLEYLDKVQINPDYIIGDFDSVNNSILKKYENKGIDITYLKPEKDFTDTHMALKKGIEIGSTKIVILGGIGTRMDHTLANIYILKEALENNIEAYIINENNKIALINNGYKILRDNEYKYISIIPFTQLIKGVTLEGFKYELKNDTLRLGQSIGVSNEQINQEATIKIKEGITILIFSKD